MVIWSLIKTAIALVVFASLTVCGATVPIGDRTFFEHVARIWQADETRELVDGVKKESGPMFERVRRGVEKGLEEAARDPDEPAAEDDPKSEDDQTPPSPERLPKLGG